MDQARDPMPPAADLPPDALTLRILDGLQQGAEAPLREDLPYLLGRDDDCDLVLWDDSVALRHLELLARAGHLQLRALDAPVALPERTLAPGAAIEVAPAIAIRLGLVGIGLGPARTDWRRLPLPAPLPADWNPAPGTSDEPESEPEPTAPSADAANDDADASATPGMPDNRLSASQPSGSRRSRMPILLGGLLPTLALGLLATYLADPEAWRGWLPWHASPPADTVDQAPVSDPATELRALAETHGLADIAIATRPDGMLELRGYCETAPQCDATRAALRAAGLGADARLWPEDRLRELLAQTVARIGGAQLRHEYLGQGRVRLHGYARPGLGAEQLVDTVKNDVPGVTRVTAELGDPPASLAPETRIQPHAGKPPDPGARASAPPPTPAAAPEPRVRGILVGPGQTSYALLDNGARIQVGDRIGDRHVVEEIRFDRVIARDGERRKVFHLGVLSP